LEKQEAGQPETVLARIEKLTEASRCFEQELAQRAQAEAFLQAVLASVGAGLMVANQNYQLVLFNRAAERILGRGITDAPPEEWPEVFGFYLANGTTPCPAIELPLVRAVGGEAVEYAELVVRNANLPEPICLAVKANPVLDDQGHLKGGVAVFQDMTSHRELEEQCRRSEQRLSSVLDCLPHMLAAMIGSDGQGGAIKPLGEPPAGILANGATPSSLN
jgi:PAS domain-containing protein